DMIDLLTIEEVAERLRVSVLTVRWLRQEGRFCACDQGWPPPGMGRSGRSGLAGISPRAHGGGQMSVQRYTLRSGAVRYRGRVKFHGREVAARVFERRADAIAWGAGPTPEAAAWGVGRTPAVAGFRCRMWRPNGSIPAVWSSAGPGRATSRTGATTSGLVSATGRWPRSRPLRCRPGSAAWLTVAWPRRPQPRALATLRSILA